MKDSKALKVSIPCLEKDEGTFWYMTKYHFRHSFLYPIKSFYRRLTGKLERAYAFAKIGWENYDWDMAYSYELLGWKLKRLYKALESGHTEQQPEDMKALLSLIKVLRRLQVGNYDSKYYRIHDRKWGKIESSTTPNYDADGKVRTYNWHTWRAKTKDASPEIKEQERAETRAIWANAEADRCKDIDKMAELLKNHAQSWWD